MQRKPKILIIYTGGTIGMIEDPATGVLRPFDFNHLIENVPRVKKLDYEIDNIQFDSPIDSSDMTPAHWQAMARGIAENYDKYDGFVVLHGTDTMAYTASALSFMLENLRKPVIITGSQLPIGEVRTDGEENLITALQIAAARDTDGRPMVQEVAILFENFLWRGNRASKRSADNFNAFTSNNYPPLARIGLDIYYDKDALARSAAQPPLNPRYALDTSVISIDLFPGLTSESLRHALATPGIKGVVLRTFGAGNTPTAPWFVDEIKSAIDRGIIIVNVTQCASGSVRAIYKGCDALASAGVISGRDITFEAAITKLMFLLGIGLEHSAVRTYLNTPLCGEMTA
ncbi:MAG: type I asparaginase [Clostridium sp.]|nr:type I asparaginase [Clostridium sp.]